LTKFMFDTNVFGKILKMNSPHDLLVGEHQYFVTSLQRDELQATPDENMRNQLLAVFQTIPQNAIPTETVVFDFSRFDMAKFGDGLVYSRVLEELSKRKPMQRENNIKDALIAETATKNGILLVTDDKALREVVLKVGGFAIDFSVYEQTINRHDCSNTV
jgi:predicted nucleic acid-binding protein